MATPRDSALPPARCDPAVGTHTAVLLVPPPPPPTAYPLGHLMLGSSLRNQGRYLWNCSTDGRAEPAVGLTQVFKQARESTKRVGGSRQQHPPRPGRPCPALPCARLPSGSPHTPTAVTSLVTLGGYVMPLQMGGVLLSYMQTAGTFKQGGSKVQGRETASTGPPHSTSKRSC